MAYWQGKSWVEDVEADLIRPRKHVMVSSFFIVILIGLIITNPTYTQTPKYHGIEFKVKSNWNCYAKRIGFVHTYRLGMHWGTEVRIQIFACFINLKVNHTEWETKFTYSVILHEFNLMRKKISKQENALTFHLLGIISSLFFIARTDQRFDM